MYFYYIHYIFHMFFMFFFFFFKQKTAYEMLRSLVGSEMCIRDREETDGESSWRLGGRWKITHIATPWPSPLALAAYSPNNSDQLWATPARFRGGWLIAMISSTIISRS
eukprot:TRINITY_DN1488_c0_g1_i4.p1 TRINITY_DN1488_c0_g1~~TRINITY_DN1488_c0_g1_i4.p1  ORF type:complete len:109 (+),score=21.77 TRINITY_DN1488_c0_g1_i4:68-394(+)